MLLVLMACSQVSQQACEQVVEPIGDTDETNMEWTVSDVLSVVTGRNRLKVKTPLTHDALLMVDAIRGDRDATRERCEIVEHAAWRVPIGDWYQVNLSPPPDILSIPLVITLRSDDGWVDVAGSAALFASYGYLQVGTNVVDGILRDSVYGEEDSLDISWNELGIERLRLEQSGEVMEYGTLW